VAKIQVLDLSLSVDNVVAAVAFAGGQQWVLYTGVGIGILTLRFLAKTCIRLIQKYPVLEHTAYLLLGFVGIVLCYELAMAHWFGHTHEGQSLFGKALKKFIGVVVILGLSVWYGNSPAMQKSLRPLFRVLEKPMAVLAAIGEFIGAILAFPFKLVFRLFHRKQPVPQSADAAAAPSAATGQDTTNS
jgi:hypothetical protein